jgi:hypothetical protein
MRNFIVMALVLLLATPLTILAESTSGQKRELIELLLIRERLAELNANWHENPHHAQTLNTNISTFNKLKKEIDDLSEFSWRYGMLLRKKIEDGEVMTGHNRFVVMRIADAFSVAVKKISEFSSLYAPGEKAIKKERLFEDTSLEKTKANMLWLSTHLSIFNAFIRSYDGFYRNKHTRNLLKDLTRASEGEEIRFDELISIAQHSVTKHTQKTLKNALNQYVAARRDMISHRDQQLGELIASVEANQSAHDLYNDVDFDLRTHSVSDGLSRFLSAVVGGASKFFGNIAGRFRFRKGYMYDDKKYKKQLLTKLRPLDIITEKTPFALTDTFIPGHYGHAALYLGSEDELKSIGMWDHPVIKPHQKEIKKGKVILESLRRELGLIRWKSF